MGGQLDRVLQSIDAGLQSSLEHGYGTDHAPELCARCQTDPPASTSRDLCEGCRAWLLGDVDVDPAEHGRTLDFRGGGFAVIDEVHEFAFAAEQLSVVLSASVDECTAALQSAANAFAEPASSWLEIDTAEGTRRFEFQCWVLTRFPTA